MNPRKRTLATACVALAAVLSLAACGTEAATQGGSQEAGEIPVGPGVDPASRTIRIGNLTALTGPIAVIGEPTTAAYEAYFQSLNARGGIDGWQLELVSRDTQYIPAEHVRAFNEIRGDIALLSSTGAPTTQAILDQLKQEKLVTQPISFDTVWGLHPVLAPLGTPYSIEAMNAIDYQVKENGAQGGQFGIVYQDDAFGQDGLRGYQAVVADLGLQSVGELPYRSGETNFTAQVQQLQAAGADVVLCTCAAPALSAVVSTGASQGYTPTWIGQSLAFTPRIMSDDGTIEGTLTAAAQPLAATTFTAAFATPRSALPQTEAWEQLQADTEQYAPEYTKYLPYYVFAYAEAMMVEAILTKAIENGDLTRQGIFDAKNSLGEVSLGGLTADVTYTGEPAPPSRVSAISDVELDAEGFLRVVAPGYSSPTAQNYDITTIGG